MHDFQNLDLCFDEFILDCSIRGLDPKTITAYTGGWRRFVRAMDLDTTAELTAPVVKRYTLQLKQEGKADATINNYLRTIRTVLRWFADDEQGFIDPVKVSMVKEHTEIKEVFTAPQLRRILAKPLPTDKYITWRCWMTATILNHTGMRGQTLLRVRWADVDFKTATMTLQHTKSKARLIPMSAELMKALTQYRRRFNPDPDGFLISKSDGSELATRSQIQAMKRYHTERGISLNSLHQYRRTFIMTAINNGKDSLKVARMVGHRDTQMLNKHYLPHSVELLRDLVD